MRAFSLSAIAIISIGAFTASSTKAALTISDKATENVSCSSGVCAATAKKAVLNVTDLANMIAMLPVTIQSGSMAQDIVFDAPFSWTSSNSLTLDAYRSITVNKVMSDAGLAPVTITTNDGSKKGELSFSEKGSISFQSTENILTIDGNAYVLIDSVPTLASDILSNNAGHYALANNIEGGSYGQSPVLVNFSGTFEGLGNAIANFTVSTTSGQGNAAALFTFVDTLGRVSHLRMPNVDIKTPDGGVFLAGAIAGESEGVLSSDSASGRIDAGISNSGGLVGESSGTITNCRSSVVVNVDAGEYVGGLAGVASLIVNSYATGDVSVVGKILGHYPLAVGGLVGLAGSVSQSYATGSIVAGGKNETIGGLAGEATGAISNSYALGSVKNNGPRALAGGFVGAYDDGSGSIRASYSTGRVSSKRSTTGGFAGYFGKGHTGTGLYWDTTTSRQPQAVGSGTDPGITGLTDKQLKSGLPAGFDPKIWAQNPKINNGYPYLIANPPEK